MIGADVEGTDVAVRTTQLTKRDALRTRVDSVTFDIPAGEIVGLLGPNGSGKTTLLKMVLGLVRPSSGSAELLGCPVGSNAFAATLARVGSLIEAPALYGQLSVRDNLIVEARTRRVTPTPSLIARLLDVSGLGDRADSRASTLSLGMKQRLGIALAMVADPPLLLLDEPANGLDPAGVVEVRSTLADLAAKGTTVIVSSHQLAEVQLACDRLVVMSAGVVVADGPTDEILRRFASDRFVVRLDRDDLAVARCCLEAAALGCDLDTASCTLTVSLPEGWTGGDLNRMLGAVGVHPLEIHREAVTLEAAFLAMTDNPKKVPEHAPS